MALIFLVDDDEDDREFFLLAVEAIGGELTCETASGGKQAMAALRDTESLPDIIFLDLNMPLMDGRECLRELKGDVKTKSVPVIMFSTSSEQYDIEDTKKIGATDFVTKPSKLKELSDSIRSTIHLHLNKK